MTNEDKKEILSVLAEAKKYIKYAHDDAESRHDSYGDDYMSMPLYEIMKDTEKLLERIDAIVSGEAPMQLEISAYALPRDCGIIERCSQRDRSYKWAIRRNGSCFNNEGEWEYEPMPSSRDDDFMLRCRYDSAELAYSTWAKFNS